MITKIKMTNIKGFGNANNEFEVGLSENKINILVAPNGFGKTSLTSAFMCVSSNGRRLQVPTELKYMKNETLTSVFRLTEDGITYVSNRTQNQIADRFNCQVISSLLMADTKTVRVNNGYTKTNGILAIEEVSICKALNKPKNPYKLTKLRSIFGNNNKVLGDISPLLENNDFISVLLEKENLDIFTKFKARMRNKLLTAIIDNIHNSKGTVAQIKANVDLTDIKSDYYYAHFSDLLKRFYVGQADWEVFSIFWQLQYLVSNELSWLRNLGNYLEFVCLREKLDENLKDFNSSWKENLKSVVENSILKVKFPKADELSNGQRDVMAFIVQLMNANNKLKVNKKNIIVIDEIFDYMDDANLIAAQYYLTKYLDLNKGNLYVLILSHLDPEYFKNYIFSKNKLNVCYLNKQAIELSEEMKAFLCFRNNLDKKDLAKKELYDDISSYYVHYNPQIKDLTSQITGHHPHLQTSWFKEDNLKKYILGELNKYLSNQENYDPYSVCLAIRIRVEKLTYNMLHTKKDKDVFLNTHKTKDKLRYAEKLGILIPDSYYVMGAIYNDAEHLRDNNNDKNCIYKLYNKVIKNIIKEFFCFDGNLIKLDALK